MILRGKLSLAAIAQGSEERSRAGPLLPSAGPLAERKRGRRCCRKKSKQPLTIGKPGSGTSHLDCREPQPPPPPNSPRCNVLGHPIPLEGVPFINHHWHPVSSPVGAGGRAGGVCAPSSSSEETTNTPMSHNKIPRTTSPHETDDGEAVTPLERENKSSFFHVVLSVMRMEVKRRENLNSLENKREGTERKENTNVTTFKSSFTNPRQRQFQDIANLSHRSIRSKSLYALEKNTQKSQEYYTNISHTVGCDVISDKNNTEQHACNKAPIHGDDKLLPPLIIKKDNTITNSLKSSSKMVSSLESPEKESNNIQAGKNSFQKYIQKNKSNLFNSRLEKKHKISTEILIEKLTEGGITFSSLFNVGKIKLCNTIRPKERCNMLSEVSSHSYGNSNISLNSVSPQSKPFENTFTRNMESQSHFPTELIKNSTTSDKCKTNEIKQFNNNIIFSQSLLKLNHLKSNIESQNELQRYAINRMCLKANVCDDQLIDDSLLRKNIVLRNNRELPVNVKVEMDRNRALDHEIKETLKNIRGRKPM